MKNKSSEGYLESEFKSLIFWQVNLIWVQSVIGTGTENGIIDGDDKWRDNEIVIARKNPLFSVETMVKSNSQNVIGKKLTLDVTIRWFDNEKQSIHQKTDN